MLNKSKPADSKVLTPFYRGALAEFRCAVADETKALAADLARTHNRRLLLHQGHPRIVERSFDKLAPLVDQVIEAHIEAGDRDHEGIVTSVVDNLVRPAADASKWPSQALFAARGAEIPTALEAKRKHLLCAEVASRRLQAGLRSRVGAVLLRVPRRSRHDRAIDWFKNTRLGAGVMVVGMAAGAVKLIETMREPVSAAVTWAWEHMKLFS